MNRWTGLGYLTRDPERVDTPGGTTICLLRIGVQRAGRDGKDGFSASRHSMVRLWLASTTSSRAVGWRSRDVSSSRSSRRVSGSTALGSRSSLTASSSFRPDGVPTRSPRSSPSPPSSRRRSRRGKPRPPRPEPASGSAAISVADPRLLNKATT
jgi:hypothetical protein